MSISSSSSSSWWNAWSPVKNVGISTPASTSTGSAGNSTGSSTTTATGSKGTTPNDNNNVFAAVVGLVLELGVILVTSYVASIFLTKLLAAAGLSSSPQSLEEQEQKASGNAAEKRLHALWVQRQQQQPNGETLELPTLTSYERQIAQDVIDPNDISVEFGDIGGMDDLKQELFELAVLPLQHPELFQTSHLLSPPGGILLYGPPGTGKTMLAKAIAKEASATFLAVKLSKIMNKWFGESNKLIDAIFSLATKLAPSIIFIDELDTFLNPRDGSENSAGNAIKAEFLTLWDGITTSSQKDTPIIVLGATNRPNQVDNAILRRLPRMFRIPLPDAQGRLDILKLTLQSHPMEESAREYLHELAFQHTKGYSGSDLKELCHCAAMESVREVMKETSRQAVMNKKNMKGSSKPGNNSKKEIIESKKKTSAPLRPMSRLDLDVARSKVKRTGQDAEEYERQEQFQKAHPSQQRRRMVTVNPNDPLFQSLAALSQALSNAKNTNDDDDDDEDNEESLNIHPKKSDDELEDIPSL